MPNKDPNPKDQKLPARLVPHAAIAVLFLDALVMLYTVGVVLGLLGEEHKIDAVNLAMIVLAVLCTALLVWPEGFERLKLFEMAGLKLELREIARAVSAQDKRITELLRVSMSHDIFKHLCGIAILKHYQYHDKFFRREMYVLKDNGFIMPMAPYPFLEFGEWNDGDNLAERAKPTEVGWFAIEFRKTFIPAELLTDKENIADETSLKEKGITDNLLSYVLSVRSGKIPI